MYRLRGMSFIDVIVGIALMLIIFTGLVGLLRSSLQITTVSKARAVATTVAESQMEYIRSLDYDAVGTVGGIPAGPIVQSTTTIQNGVAITLRTFIQFEDDPADGVGAADQNGIPTDYKRVKVSASYTSNGRVRDVTLVSTYAPPGIETTTGGGTLRINVVGATGLPVPGATVRIQNTAALPTIDLTTFSDADGVVFLPGAPTSTQYQIAVSKTGFSSAQTYARDAVNQNPTPGFLTVAANQTTTGTFVIAPLTALTIRTLLPIATTTYADTFASAAQVPTLNNTTVSGGAIVLTGAPGTYMPSGNATSVAISPTFLAGWGTVVATTSLPAGTSVRIQLRDGAGVLLPDTALPGNAVGFTGSVPLGLISTTTYPSLALSVALTTSSASSTPSVLDWSISYARGPIPTGTIPFTLTGIKRIGSTGSGIPIIKTTIATSTDTNGIRELSLEWDSYALAISGVDVVDACSGPPFDLAPGTSQNNALFLASSTSNRLLVTVESTTTPITAASVTLSRPGFTRTVLSTACGGAYFGAIGSASDYTISVTKTGFTSFNATGLTVTGHTFYAVPLE